MPVIALSARPALRDELQHQVPTMAHPVKPFAACLSVLLQEQHAVAVHPKVVMASSQPDDRFRAAPLQQPLVVGHPSDSPQRQDSDTQRCPILTKTAVRHCPEKPSQHFAGALVQKHVDRHRLTLFHQLAKYQYQVEAIRPTLLAASSFQCHSRH